MSGRTLQAHDPATAWADHARERLREQGARPGGARHSVIDLLAAQRCCLSAQEIWGKLREGGDAPGLASVYRALELLHELDLVQRVQVGGGTSRYEPALPGGDHHHHVVCDRCGRIASFEDEQLEEAIAALADRLRHRISAHEVVLRGACPRCARRRSSPAGA